MAFSLFFLFFGCIAVLLVVGILVSIFTALLGRRRWGYGGYYGRPRPFWPWLFFRDPYPRRGFFEPRPFERRERFERFEHHHEHHHHHPGGGFGGGHHHGGGGFGGGGHHGGHH